MTPWLAPTVRVTNWRPFLIALATILSLGVLLDVAGTSDAGTVVLAACGLLAATTVLAFDDPAHALLAALPTTARRRHGQRLTVVAPVVLGVWTALSSVGRRAFDGWPSSTTPSVVALCGVGLLAMVLAERERLDVAVQVGAVVPALWVAVGSVTSTSGWAQTVAELWRAHPWPLAVATFTAAWLVAPR